ncbi:MAG: redoxin domain-containing protein [bacterium]|nr:redoxin domain-containing protein [bacterium]
MFTMKAAGPALGTQLPNFCLPDHRKVGHSLNDLMGGVGLMLGFIGDVWQPTSVRRILWLQNQVHKFSMMGTPVALLVRDQPHTLYGFQMSSPMPVPFPVLADADGCVHSLYHMDRQPGLLLIDRNFVLRQKWVMTDERVWPKMQELIHAAQSIQALA